MLKKILSIALSMFLMVAGFISSSTLAHAEEIENMDDFVVYVDYENTIETEFAFYNVARGATNRYATATPVVGVPPNVTQSVLLGYVYCYSDFDMGAKKAISGFTSSKASAASSFIDSGLTSYVKQEYAKGTDVAAQVRHTGTLYWIYAGYTGTTPFNLSHYCNINGYCYNSTYSA